MKITWASLEFYMNHPHRVPPGWSVSYQFQPMFAFHPDDHKVLPFWMKHNPDADRTDFWVLEKEERQSWDRAWADDLCRNFAVGKANICAWERFTVVDANGNEMILQMKDHKVTQLKRVKRVVESLEPCY